MAFLKPASLPTNRHVPLRLPGDNSSLDVKHVCIPLSAQVIGDDTAAPAGTTKHVHFGVFVIWEALQFRGNGIVGNSIGGKWQSFVCPLTVGADIEKEHLLAALDLAMQFLDRYFWSG